jgi:hypothetical protein
MEASSHAEMLPKNLIASIPVQDLNGRGFRGLLSCTTVHAFNEMGKTREQRSKGNLVARETERMCTFYTWSVSWYSRGGGPDRTAMRGREGHAASMHTHDRHVSNSVGAPSKNLVFHKMSF